MIQRNGGPVTESGMKAVMIMKTSTKTNKNDGIGQPLTLRSPLTH